MSILSGFKKVKNYILTTEGYKLLSRWTSSQTVEFDDGKTAEQKLGNINGIATTYVDMKNATDTSIAASAKAVMEGLENSSALISMTQAQYDKLSTEEKNDNNMRAIIDADPDAADAKNVAFDNSGTGLSAKNAQSAITEVNSKLLKYKDFTFTNLSNARSDIYYITLSDNIQTDINDGSVVVLTAQAIYWSTIGSNVFNVSFDDRAKTLKFIFQKGLLFSGGSLIVRVGYI